MRPDMDVKLDVEIELRSDPPIPESDIAVTVNDGVVRFVRSYGRKRAAEAAARRVVGVVGVANDIEVRLPCCTSDLIQSLPAMRWERCDMICPTPPMLVRW